MRLVHIAVVVSLLLAPLGVLVGCGGGGGGGSGGSGNPEAARSALIEVLDAARREDYAKVRGRMDVVEWLTAMGHPQAVTYLDLPKEKQEDLAQGFYRAIRSVLTTTSLPDHASIAGAVKAGSLQNLPQLKAVQIRFQAPDAERAGRQMAVDAKLRYGIDGVWRVASIQADL